MIQQILVMIAVVFALLLSGCAKPDLAKMTDPNQIWTEAEKLYADSFYEESRGFYQKIVSRYPESPYYFDSKLRLGDSYFEEGKYLLAADQYLDFVKAHPAHEKVPYALFRNGMSYEKDSPGTSDRDQTSVQKALAAYNRLQVDFPSAIQTKDAESHIQSLRHQLAERIFSIGNFYYKKSKYEAASGRFLQLIKFYPEEKEFATESYYKLIKSLLKLKRDAEASLVYQDLRKQFPDSRYIKKFSEKDFQTR